MNLIKFKYWYVYAYHYAVYVGMDEYHFTKIGTTSGVENGAGPVFARIDRYTKLHNFVQVGQQVIILPVANEPTALAIEANVRLFLDKNYYGQYIRTDRFTGWVRDCLLDEAFKWAIMVVDNCPSRK